MIHVHYQKPKLPNLAHEHLLGPLSGAGISPCMYVCMSEVCSSTHSGIAPELSHLSDPHGHQQGLPDFHLEHLSDKDLSWPTSQSTVIDDGSLKIVQQCLEIENQLG